MSKKETVYNFINILVILATAVLFIYEYKDFREIFSSVNVVQLIVLIVTVVLVHIVKAGRLYLALYGSKLKRLNYIKEYCKVTPVSMIFPFKLGELFRMYCYGKLIGNALKGVVIILLDRFMDTIALVSIIFFVWVWSGKQNANFVYFLLVFLVFSLIIYLVYPGIYKFWKKYLLKANATESKLKALRFLEYLNGIYCEVENVTKGKGIILYFMSMFAWSIEIGSLYILDSIAGSNNTYKVISNYLISAIRGSQSIELEKFVIISVVFFTGIYIIIKMSKFLIEKKDKQ